MRPEVDESARMKPQATHPKRLPYRDVPTLLRALHAGPADATKDALEWLILTATMTVETRGARFAEVSEKTATWTIPPERRKSTEHIIPLSKRALEIFAASKKRHSGKGDFIFESKRGQPLSSMALLMQMRRLKTTAVPHGFRYTFRAWAADRDKAPSDRRELLNEWSSFCATGGKWRH